MGRLLREDLKSKLETFDYVYTYGTTVSLAAKTIIQDKVPQIFEVVTDPVGAALLDYLRHARPLLPFRELFLRVRAPAGPLAPTAVTEAFQGWTHRGRLPIPYQGPHCLRHSLAVHLLRKGASLKAIGDLLGHRGAESTCVYLRLHVEDLRDAALDLPSEARS